MIDFDRRKEACAPTYWRRMEAINGHGQLLIGPDEHSDEPGAMVIAPPGVFLRAPEGREPLTRDGWRQARWGMGENGLVLVDQARPFALLVVGLAQVVEELAEWAPEHLSWVASVVERQIRVLVGRMPRDCSGRHHSQAGTAFDELVETRQTAEDAFGRLSGHDVPDWMLDRHFLRMEQIFVAELNADRERFDREMRRAPKLTTGPGRHLRAVGDPPRDRDPRDPAA